MRSRRRDTTSAIAICGCVQQVLFIASKGAESMSRKGKIGMSVFALAVLMLVIGIAASGTMSGATAAGPVVGQVANVSSGGGNASYKADGIWAQKPAEQTLPNGVRVVNEVKHD